MKKVLATVLLAIAVTGCTHDTLQSIRDDPLEKGQFTTPTLPDVVVRNMQAMYDKCLVIRISRMYSRVLPPWRPEAATSLEIHQQVPFGNRVMLVVDVRPRDTGSEVTFYKSGGFHMLESIRPRIEKGAKGDDLTC
jgi:hypothetical protein